MTAVESEKRQLIRERAYAIWIERGRPEGCNVENWIAAERELTEAGQQRQRGAHPSFKPSLPASRP
jgi:hypothetical protein